MAERKCCAILGHSPMRFSWGFDEEASACRKLKLELLQQINNLRVCGVTQFAVACDPGVGLYAAEIINVLRESDSELMLFCVTPHEEQANKWTPELRERYFSMLEKCSLISEAAQQKLPNAQFMAFQKIVDWSDTLLAVYDPSSARGDAADKAIAYAVIKQRRIIFIHPDSFVITETGNKQ